MKRPARIGLALLLSALLLPWSYLPESHAAVSVSARIPSRPTDFQISLLSSPEGSPTTQDTTLTYTINYSTSLSYTTPLIITASWSKGQLNGAPVDALDYVTNSANKAYSNTTPVVDTVNRKITWSISAFPGVTENESVSFQLRTRDIYQGKEQITFHTSANVTDGDNEGASTQLEQSYRYVAPPPGPAISTTPTPTPTVKPERLLFTHVGIESLSKDGATVRAGTNTASRISLSYGTSPNTLGKTLTALTPQTEQDFLLVDLDPSTNYYFRVTASGGGQSITSDTFILKTARDTSTFIPAALRVTSNNISLFNPRGNESIPLVLPAQTIYTVQFALDKDTPITDGTLVVENQEVLGASSFLKDAEASTTQTALIQTYPGTFSGKLLSSNPGLYAVFAKLTDTNGNITKVALFPLHISEAFRVIDEKGNGVEGARVLLKVYDLSKDEFVTISSQSLPIKNPGVTDPRGYLDLVLPAGRYKAEVTAQNFKRSEVTFTLGGNPHENYPQVALTSAPFDLISQAAFFWAVLIEHLNELNNGLGVMTQSNRFAALIHLIVLSLFTFVMLKLISYRHNLPLDSLLSHFHHTARRLRPEAIIRGIIIDVETSSPIHNASVHLIDATNNRVLAHVFSGRDGSFQFPVNSKKRYKVNVQKNGFHQFPSVVFDEVGTAPLLIGLMPESTATELEGIIQVLGKSIVEYGFETVLFLTLLLEILLLLSFGAEKVLPFLMISLITLSLYALSKKTLS